MRNEFINWICNKAENDHRIILLTGDLGYSVVEPFADRFPDRFINVGVAEQNMIGISAGLASEGMRPYTYSIGIFPTFRCAEQIRNDIDYPSLPVTICTVGSGVAYGNLGYSHHAIQDIALMRSMPNMNIATPCDQFEVRNILQWQYDKQQPTYLRLHKSGEPPLNNHNKTFNNLNKIYEPKINTNDVKNKTCILVEGFIASSIKTISEDANSPYPVYSVPLWGQPFKDYFKIKLKDYKRIITVEDHLLEGGLASYLLEISSRNNLGIDIVPINLSPDTVGKVAKEATLLNELLNNFRSLLKNLILKTN